MIAENQSQALQKFEMLLSKRRDVDGDLSLHVFDVLSLNSGVDFCGMSDQ